MFEERRPSRGCLVCLESRTDPRARACRPVLRHRRPARSPWPINDARWTVLHPAHPPDESGPSAHTRARRRGHGVLRYLAPRRASKRLTSATGRPVTGPVQATPDGRGPPGPNGPRGPAGNRRTPSGRNGSISGSRRSRCPRAGSPRPSRGPGRGSRSRRSRRSGTARPWPPRSAPPRCCGSGAGPYRRG